MEVRCSALSNSIKGASHLQRSYCQSIRLLSSLLTISSTPSLVVTSVVYQENLTCLIPNSNTVCRTRRIHRKSSPVRRLKRLPTSSNLKPANPHSEQGR